MHAMALPSLWHARGRPGNALDNAGLPRCTHPDNNSASRLFTSLKKEIEEKGGSSEVLHHVHRHSLSPVLCPKVCISKTNLYKVVPLTTCWPHAKQTVSRIFGRKISPVSARWPFRDCSFETRKRWTGKRKYSHRLFSVICARDKYFLKTIC